MRHITLTSAVAALTLIAAPAAAQDTTDVRTQDLAEQPDDAWISVTGTVESVAADQFILDYGATGHYGEGWITVEMDDGDRDADAYKLLAGDTVTVDGFIDDDLFETRTIEAASVYVHSLDTRFYASGVDEEDTFVTVVEPVVSQTVVQGTVTYVDEEEFRLLTGMREITVEVEEMAYNPLDESGYQQIEVGDIVTVYGDIDYDFLEGRELVANSVTTLHRSSIF